MARATDVVRGEHRSLALVTPPELRRFCIRRASRRNIRVSCVGTVNFRHGEAAGADFFPVAPPLVAAIGLELVRRTVAHTNGESNRLVSNGDFPDSSLDSSRKNVAREVNR